MSTTNTDTETGWSKEFPSQTGDYWFRTDEHDPMVIIEISGGGIPGGAPVPFRVYEFGMEEGGISKATFQRKYRRAEYLGPISPSDFEQLIRLRKALSDALESLDAQRRSRCTYCAKEFEWDAEQNCHVWRAEGDKFDGQLMSCSDLPLRLIADEIREALAQTKGE